MNRPNPPKGPRQKIKEEKERMDKNGTRENKISEGKEGSHEKVKEKVERMRGCQIYKKKCGHASSMQGGTHKGMR